MANPSGSVRQSLLHQSFSQGAKGVLSPIRSQQGSRQGSRQGLRIADLSSPSAVMTPLRPSGSIIIPLSSTQGALGAMPNPISMDICDVKLLEDDDVIGDLDFVSLLTGNKTGHPMGHAKGSFSDSTPGVVLTDVFQNLREQNAKIVRSVNLLISAGRQHKTNMGDLSTRMDDLTAATNTLITATRNLRIDLTTADTSLKAIRTHMLLVQDQVKQLVEAAGRQSNAGPGGRSPFRSYNMYGRVYGQAHGTDGHAKPGSSNPLAGSVFMESDIESSPSLHTATTPVSEYRHRSSSSHNDAPSGAALDVDALGAEDGKMPEYMRRIAEQNASKMTGDATAFKTALLHSVRRPSSKGQGKGSVLKGNNAPNSTIISDAAHGSEHMMGRCTTPTGPAQSPQSTVDTASLVVVDPLQMSRHIEQEAAQKQRLDALERNLRRVMEHLGLEWED